MSLRIADCGLRNERAGVGTRHEFPLPIRNPKSAIRNILLLLAACTPVTTRPDFKPDPRALVVVLNARPERVAVALDSLVPAESLEVARSNVRDGYVETAWYDTEARRTRHHERDIASFTRTVKIRFWADPWVPGQTRLTIEPVYRPRSDPSRVERDLEVIVDKDDDGYKLAQRFVEGLKKRFGVPKAAQEPSRP